ncbi:unnamed protein product [Urochloa humidicola]
MSTTREQPPLGRLPHEQRPHFDHHHHHGGGGGYDGGDREPQHDWRHDDRRRRRPRYDDYRGRHRSGALQWAAAVVFTVLAVAVLLAAVTILVVVVLLQPKSPYLAVRSARLDALVYPQGGAALDDVQVSLLVEARNGNKRSAAVFSRLELRLALAGGGGGVLAKLRADPFAVPPEGSLPLAYVARAQGAPLDAAGSAAVEAALRGGVVPFGVDGEAKTAWKVAGVVGVRHWTRMACEIKFFWPNGSAMHFNCNSKSKFLFF